MAAPPLTEPAAFPKKLHGLAENIPGEGQGKASASELPYGGSLLLWQPHLSTAEAACRARRQSARASGLREVLAGGFCRVSMIREDELCIIVKRNNNKNVYL